jgi:hypothetical protein
MNTELRVTDTNSANDSKGRALGFEGNDFLYVVIGVVAAIGLFLVLYGMFHTPLGTATAVAMPFAVGPFLWVVLLRHNKPEGYASDLFDHLMNREGWTCVADNQPMPLPQTRRRP